MKANGAGLRKLAYWGARYGPTAFVRYSPTVIGVTFAALLPELRSRVRRNLRRVRGATHPVMETMDVVRTFVEYAHCLAESLGAERARSVASKTLARAYDRIGFLATDHRTH